MKNLFKKIGALLVAAVMVLSMCTAVFADDTTKATITVKTPDGDLVLGGSDNTTIWCVQVIEPDPTTETGWKFSNGVESAFTSSFSNNGNNVEAQTAIKMLANKAAQDNGQTLKYADVAAATSAQFENALAAVNVTDANKVKKNPINVNKAGVYAIKVAQSGYTYKEMAAYVGFSDNMVVEGNVDVDAKRSSKVINKSVKEDPDHVVAIGDIKTYTVETEVPAFTPIDANKYFAVKDSIKGAEYVKAENSNDVAVNVKVDGKEVSGYSIVMGEGTFTIILKDNRDGQTTVDAKVNNESVINDSNSYYAKKLVVTYQAKITDVTATNTAYGNVGSGEKSSTSVNLYTGTIKVIKQDTNSKKSLQNAKFVVYRMNDGKKEYAKLTDDGKLAGWTEAVNKDDVKIDIKNGNTKNIGIIVTDSKGEATVSGLDLGDYYFEEVEAPTGYSLDASPEKVTVVLNNVTEAKATTDVISDPLTKFNTKLNSLPSTGGMGTYLFTIIGVVFMAGAAGAFFISRRKGSEE